MVLLGDCAIGTRCRFVLSSALRNWIRREFLKLNVPYLPESMA